MPLLSDSLHRAIDMLISAQHYVLLLVNGYIEASSHVRLPTPLLSLPSLRLRSGSGLWLHTMPTNCRSRTPRCAERVHSNISLTLIPPKSCPDHAVPGPQKHERRKSGRCVGSMLPVPHRTITWPLSQASLFHMHLHDLGQAGLPSPLLVTLRRSDILIRLAHGLFQPARVHLSYHSSTDCSFATSLASPLYLLSSSAVPRCPPADYILASS